MILYGATYVGRVPLSSYPSNCWAGLRPILTSFWPFFLAALAGLSDGAFRPDDAPWPSARSLVLVALWLLSSAWATGMGGAFRGHYFILAAPAFSVLAAAGIVRLVSRAGRGWRPLAAFCVAACFLAYGISRAPWYYLPGDPGLKAR